ncbi:MAG: cellulose-binding protein [Gammaproteobacteria bacterium]|nr:cellulose-binding protein [Gammaproteobacteria bacterium]
MILGNSITQAQTSQQSFRYPLWKKLIDANIAFDYVGSMSKHRGSGNPPQPDYKGQKFDKDHEGHFAWQADEIIIGRSTNYGDSGTGNLKAWLKTYDVDIALIHLGTNDAFNRQSNGSTAEELKTIIRTLRADNAKVAILLAKVIPTSRSPGDAKAVAALNEYIPKVATEMNTANSPVILVDQFTGFDASTDTYDAVHPNAMGEEKMAQRWFDGIKSYLETQASK